MEFEWLPLTVIVLNLLSRLIRYRCKWETVEYPLIYDEIPTP